MNRPEPLVTMTESFNEDVFMLYQKSAGAGVAKGRKARADWLTDDAESPHWMLLRVSLEANPDHASYILASVDEWQATKPIDVQRLAENASDTRKKPLPTQNSLKQTVSGMHSSLFAQGSPGPPSSRWHLPSSQNSSLSQSLSRSHSRHRPSTHTSSLPLQSLSDVHSPHSPKPHLHGLRISGTSGDFKNCFAVFGPAPDRKESPRLARACRYACDRVV